MRRLSGISLAIVTTGLIWATASAGDLTIEERVEAAQTLETAAQHPPTPRAVIERKIRNALRQTAALEELWVETLSADLLNAELERMVLGSKRPARLREMFRALDDDSLLLRECLARPVLVERLIRERYASEARFHEEALRKLTQAQETFLRDPGAKTPAGVNRIVMDAVAAEQTVGTVGALKETSHAFVFRVPLSDSEDAVYSVPKRPFGSWWRRSRNASTRTR